MNGVIHTIINENLYNKEYVKTQTIGFDDLKKSTENYSPENMEKICGISAERIRHLAREYAKSKSIIFWGMGISQHTHGTDNARCLISLALLTGNIGLPGTGLNPLRGQNNVQGALMLLTMENLKGYILWEKIQLCQTLIKIMLGQP